MKHKIDNFQLLLKFTEAFSGYTAIASTFTAHTCKGYYTPEAFLSVGRPLKTTDVT